MKVVIDENKCVGCGACESICPEVFRVGDDGVAHVIGECKGFEECCKEAADTCPAEAIIIAEE